MDNWQEFSINCHGGIAKWDFIECMWVWKMPPNGLLKGDPVPHEWDFDYNPEDQMQRLVNRIQKAK